MYQPEFPGIDRAAGQGRAINKRHWPRVNLPNKHILKKTMVSADFTSEKKNPAG